MNIRRHGFTLIELLVVIAVIAVLAAILFPVFSQARNKAHQVNCISNVRQIGMAMLLYAGDYDSHLPMVRRYTTTPLFKGSWIEALHDSYLENLQVFICPSASEKSTDWQNNDNLMHNYGYPPSAAAARDSYPPINELVSFLGVAKYAGLGGYGNGALGKYKHPAPSVNQDTIPRPSEMILISDHSRFDWGLTEGSFYYPTLRHMPSTRSDGTSLGQLSCCFLDGHAKALRHEQYWETRSIRSSTFGWLDVYWHFWIYD